MSEKNTPTEQSESVKTACLARDEHLNNNSDIKISKKSDENASLDSCSKEEITCHRTGENKEEKECDDLPGKNIFGITYEIAMAIISFVGVFFLVLQKQIVANMNEFVVGFYFFAFIFTAFKSYFILKSKKFNFKVKFQKIIFTSVAVLVSLYVVLHLSESALDNKIVQSSLSWIQKDLKDLKDEDVVSKEKHKQLLEKLGQQDESIRLLNEQHLKLVNEIDQLKKQTEKTNQNK